MAESRTRRPGRPPATNRTQIARGALDLARAEGLEAVTIRRLSEFLNIAPMTLYRYAKTKEDVVDLMVATALDAMDRQSLDDAPWPEQLHRSLMTLYDTLCEHYVIIELLVSSQAIVGPALDKTRNALVHFIGSAPVPEERAIRIFNTLGAFVIGVAAVEGGRARRGQDLARHLSLLESEEFPDLTAVQALWVAPLERPMVAAGLRHLLDGLLSVDPQQPHRRQ